jgi:diacylglycerol kinase (ATP)
MRGRILFVINPIAGGSGNRGMRAWVEEACRTRGVDGTVFMTEAGTRPDDLRRAAEGMARVVACGGDGTVRLVATALMRTGVPLGIVPSGSGNGLALAAGISLNRGRAFTLAVEGAARAIDAYRVNDEIGFVLAGLGYDAEVAHRFAASGKRGLLSYARQALGAWREARPYRLEVERGARTERLEAFALCVANANQFGNRVRAVPQADLADGMLDGVLIRTRHRALLPVPFVYQAIRGRPATEAPPASGVWVFRDREFVVRNPDGAPRHTDGEPMPLARTLHFQVDPGAVRLAGVF